MTQYLTFGARVRRAWDTFWESRRPDPPVPEQRRPDGPRDTLEYEPPTGSEVLVVASRGDVFDLHLIPYFQWSSAEMDLDMLAARSGRYVEPARGRLLREVWRTTRAHGPNDAAAAEKAINNLQVLRDGWCYTDDEGMIRCRPTVRVTLDPRLREHTLPFELDRLRLDAHHRYGLVHAGYVEERAQRWLKVIKSIESIEELGVLERQFLAPFAAMLTDKDFASTMTQLANVRNARTNDLAGVLRQAGKNHESVGLFEFARAYDKAVEAFSRQMGLDPYHWMHDGTTVGGAE
ncbi:hypothetical protein [Symbioplanes lichenis]|uniref:hypothetical protein n=1 Tax=Symbioplanes lichenis TaxID=1629072 RepID=UPI002738A04D|nr:hypothetical protein [Actinoplanes lichenis]